jgi:hypothetical protein
LTAEEAEKDHARDKRDDHSDNRELPAQSDIARREQRDADRRGQRRQQHNPRQNVGGGHSINTGA